jgi:homocysteine S-methyltransferase
MQRLELSGNKLKTKLSSDRLRFPSRMQSLSQQFKQRLVLLDGGMGSALESKLPRQIDGHALWSAAALLDHEDVVYEAHSEFAAAGCNILTAVTYQLSPQGCSSHAAFENESGDDALIRLCGQAVSLARRAAVTSAVAHPVLVAGSVGPMGAAFHDGSEFTGSYPVSPSSARAFHETRLRALHSSGVDILALETQCNWAEVQWLADNVHIICPGLPAWVSFQVRSGLEIADGTPLQQAVRRVLECPAVVAVGVNCAESGMCLEAVQVCAREVAMHFSAGGPQVDVIAYPNGGGTWNGELNMWEGRAAKSSFAHSLQLFVNAGVTVLGGCCRVKAEDISEAAIAARKLQLL